MEAADVRLPSCGFDEPENSFGIKLLNGLQYLLSRVAIRKVIALAPESERDSNKVPPPIFICLGNMIRMEKLRTWP